MEAKGGRGGEGREVLREEALQALEGASKALKGRLKGRAEGEFRALRTGFEVLQALKALEAPLKARTLLKPLKPIFSRSRRNLEERLKGLERELKRWRNVQARFRAKQWSCIAKSIDAGCLRSANHAASHSHSLRRAENPKP